MKLFIGSSSSGDSNPFSSSKKGSVQNPYLGDQDSKEGNAGKDAMARMGLGSIKKLAYDRNAQTTHKNWM